MMQKIFKSHEQTRIVLTFVFILVVFLGPFIAPESPWVSQLDRQLEPPSLQHFFGTDAHGKDIVSLILYGARNSLLVSVCVVSLCLFLGLIIGYCAGFFGGIFDKFFLIIAEIFQAFPGTLLAIAIASFMKPSLSSLIGLLSFVGWVSYARVVRTQCLQLKNREYIVAAQTLGLNSFRLLWKHVLPNIAGPLIVQASFGLAGIILVESTLSYLGLGLPPEIPSLGKQIDSGVSLLLVAPHVALFPGLVIMCFVLMFNSWGDWLRQKLESNVS